MKDPYTIIKHQHITEKAQTLAHLQDAESNPSVRRCKSPKYVFIVDRDANKHEIKQAVETIYKAQNIRVTQVNTIRTPGKEKRMRGRKGRTAETKKAVVTLEEGDKIELV